MAEAKSKYDFYLVVKNPFWGYKKGQRISVDAEITKIINGGHLKDCLKVKR